MVLASAAGVAYAGGEGTEGGGKPAVSCEFAPESHELKLRNTSKVSLASGKTVQVTYKTADGTVKTHDFRMSSELGAGRDIHIKSPFEPNRGATCSAKVQ